MVSELSLTVANLTQPARHGFFSESNLSLVGKATLATQGIYRNPDNLTLVAITVKKFGSRLHNYETIHDCSSEMGLMTHNLVCRSALTWTSAARRPTINKDHGGQAVDDSMQENVLGLVGGYRGSVVPDDACRAFFWFLYGKYFSNCVAACTTHWYTCEIIFNRREKQL